MGLLDIFRKPAEPERTDPSLSIAQWAQMFESFNYNGLNYTLPGASQEAVGATYAGLSQGAFKQDGVIFACMAVRALLFSEIRFMYRRLRSGRPGDLFGNPTLELLNHPWPNGTTGDLTTRMIQHADLAGNAFVARRQGKLAVLRPDWVSIVGGVKGSEKASVWHPDAEILGYIYEEGGPGSGKPPITFDVTEVAHFAPMPDPEARFRGMSWLTPIIREVMADKAATDHKLAFFENGATPNLAVKLDTDDLTKFQAFVDAFKANHDGAGNAYKTMFLASGADTTVVGSDLKQLDFKVTQGAGETRIAAAAGVPPVIVGLSEGLEQATYSNYAQARRRLSDGTMRPLWRNAAASLATIIDVPGDAELWYDDRDIKFLQEDQKDAAEIRSSDSQTVRTLVEAGYDPKTVVEAVLADDFSRLKHTGLLSVQLQDPTAAPPDPQVVEKPAQQNAVEDMTDMIVRELIESLDSVIDRPLEEVE